MAETTVAQCEISDALHFLSRFLPPPINDFVRDLAVWFELLNENPQAMKAQCESQGITLPQGLFDGECFDRLTARLKELFLEAGLHVAEGLPGLLQELISCAMGGVGNPQAQKLDIKLTCIWSALMAYYRTRDIAQAAAAFFACQFGGSLPPGGGGPNFRNVGRC